MNRKLLLISAIALAPAAILAAQRSTRQSVAPVTPASPTDIAFVAQVAQGGAYEIAASNLALDRAHAWDVKDLAMAESHDHAGVNLRLKHLCQHTGVALPTEISSEFTDRLARLQAVKDEDFDAAYIADMQQIHDKDEKLFAAEAQQGTEDFKALAAESDLIVKRHIGALHGLDH